MRLTPGVVVTEHIVTPLEIRQLYYSVCLCMCVLRYLYIVVPGCVQYIHTDSLCGYNTLLHTVGWPFHTILMMYANTNSLSCQLTFLIGKYHWTVTPTHLIFSKQVEWYKKCWLICVEQPKVSVGVMPHIEVQGNSLSPEHDSGEI